MATLSVHTCNYNHAKYLPRCIESVATQSRPPDEFIILDDGSTDESLEIIQDYAKKFPFIRLEVNKKNQGVMAAVEKLLTLARGDYCLGHAADDFILPGLLEKSMVLLQKYPKAGFCSSLSLSADGKGDIKGLFPSPVISSTPIYLSPQGVKEKLKRYGAWFMGNTLVYRRQALIDVGGYRKELFSFTDGFAHHAMALKYGACFIPEPLAAWRLTETNYSGEVSKSITHMGEIVNRVTHLMQSPDSPYEGLFPQKYVEDWKRRKTYWMGSAMSGLLRKQQRQFLNDLNKIVPPRGFFPKLGNGLAKISIGCRSLTKLSFLLRSFTWPATPLMVRWIFCNFRYRVHKPQ